MIHKVISHILHMWWTIFDHPVAIEAVEANWDVSEDMPGAHAVFRIRFASGRLRDVERQYFPTSDSRLKRIVFWSWIDTGKFAIGEEEKQLDSLIRLREIKIRTRKFVAKIDSKLAKEETHSEINHADEPDNQSSESRIQSL